MHIVHVKSGLQEPLKDFPNYIDGLAVTGFMFNIGATNPAIESSYPVMLESAEMIGSIAGLVAPILNMNPVTARPSM
jgi:hypothetical protein